MKIKKTANALICVLGVLVIYAAAQETTDQRTPKVIQQEIERYAADEKIKLARSGGYTAAAASSIAEKKKKLAKQYAAELALRTDLKETDYFYLGRIYDAAGNDEKVLESMQKFLAAFPPTIQGDMVQLALDYVVTIASNMRRMAVAQPAFDRWVKGESVNVKQQARLRSFLAAGYFKAGGYAESIKHGQAAFDILKALETKGVKEKRDREKMYVDLVEILALAYRKGNNSEQSLNLLAEARVQSFAIPSADLYRQVMSLVDGGGFSEKKLMQKVESYPAADPAPEITITDWIGTEPTSLEQLRGKVVLLDFWATWCGPCIATFPRLRNWHKKYSGSNFMIVGVTQYYGRQGGKLMTSLQEFDFLREFKEKHELPYAVAIADPAEARMKYGIAAFPTTVLLDRNGVVRYIGIGAGLEESENLEDMIKKLLKEEPRVS